jgi:hypothetical protein
MAARASVRVTLPQILAISEFRPVAGWTAEAVGAGAEPWTSRSSKSCRGWQMKANSMPFIRAAGMDDDRCSRLEHPSEMRT